MNNSNSKVINGVLGYPVIEKMYNDIQMLLQNYRDKHSKVFIVRFNLNYEKDKEHGENNVEIQHCMARTMKFLNRRGLDAKYAWVREQHTSENPHYHGVILVNGHKTRNQEFIFDTVERFWLSSTGQSSQGLLDKSEHYQGDEFIGNGEVIYRSQELSEITEGKISYLCKPQTKGQPKDGLRDYGMSRVNFNNNITKKD